MQIADFYYGVVLTIFLMSVISASCPRSLKCPCGNTSEAVYYTHCINDTLEKYTCERWSNCRTCEADVTHCLTCHSGRSGPTCEEDADKRNRTNNPVEDIFGSCPQLLDPLSGKAICLTKKHVRECTASCLPGFYFERLKNVNLITLRCREDVWTPLQEFPPCRPGPRCTLRVRGDGHFHCTSDEDGAHCDVTCDGSFKGRYHCNLREWSSSLPHCVVPAAEKAIALCQDPGKNDDLVRRNADGTAADNTRNFEEGESIRFLCKKKKKTLRGHSLITCRPDGTWSGALPHCTNTSSSDLDSSPSEAVILFPTIVWLNIAIWFVSCLL